MKKYFLFACVAAALVSCSSDEFLGNESGLTPNETGAILFQSTNMKASRADKVGSEAAALLGNNFVVEGVKGDGSNYTEVFDHYNVNYKANTANSTESNSSDWEYVGQDVHANSAAGAQTIKYWDFSAAQYDFVAFSYGTSNSTKLTLSEIDYTKLGTAVTAGTPVYTVEGSVEDLTKAYAADLVTVKKADYTTSVVTPRFRRMGAKVRIGMYETVPGYSVKDVVFYEDDTRTNTASTPTLYASSAVLPSGEGTMKVFYPTINSTDTDNNKAHVVFTADDVSADLSSTLAFTNGLAYTTKDAAENTTLHGTEYLGRQSNQATYATADTPANAYEYVLPYGSGNDLKLHVDYTLVPIDGAEESIEVKDATAIVPAVYTAWEPNYAYTYLFKISMNTNGTTGDPTTTDPKGLYPITFDAVVMNDMEDGILETVTSVADPSITTYAKGVRPTDASEYKAGDNIYVAVKNGTVAAGNVALYTASIETGALQSINEVTVANALVNGTQSGSTWTLTDAAGKKLTVTSATAPSIVTAIPAADSYTGNAIAGNFAMFTPAAAGTYVFEFTVSAAVNYASVSEYNAAKGTSLDETAFTALPAADKVKTPAVKAYKVIIVHA